MKPPRRIALTGRVLHWGVAALLVGSFATAVASGALDPAPVAGALIDAHRSIGLVILVLMAARLAYRIARPTPPLPDGTAAWERVVSKVVQTTFYAGLLAMPLLGWIGSDAQGDTVRLFGVADLPHLVDPAKRTAEAVFTIHVTLAWTLLALVVLHSAGALRHHFVKRDGVLRAMVTGEG